MANVRMDRHQIEYEIIPEYIYSEHSKDFVSTMIMKKHYFILEMYQMVNAGETGYQCPYLPEDFDVDAVVVGNIAGIMRVKMPPVLETGNIVRMYICHDENIERARLYTVRTDKEGDTCFMTWVDDSHYIDHGKFKLSEGDEIRTVMNFYMKYLYETNCN